MTKSCILGKTSQHAKFKGKDTVSAGVLAVNDDLPLRTDGPVHSGKVRSVYWLTEADSARLISERHYAVAPDSQLAVMVISDRISAFDCMWHGEGGLAGVPGKGASLNAISHFWFTQFQHAGLARSHILEVPHPLVWIVQRAQPLLLEAIARRFITGSMWRAYEQGAREFCGNQLPDNLHANQKLSETLVTPSTKGVMRGLDGIPEADDTNVSRAQLVKHWREFGFRSPDDIDYYEMLLRQGAGLIASHLSPLELMLVDTKFEFGYAKDIAGDEQLIYMDEVGTPDSSRIWDAVEYRGGRVVENSKEEFRQALLRHVKDPQLLLDHTRFAERKQFAAAHALPAGMLHSLSDTYRAVAARITGHPIAIPQDPRQTMISMLDDQFALVR